MLRTYNSRQTADFIFYLVKTEREEKLESIWLHSQSGMSFEEWKRKSLKGHDKKPPKKKKIDKEKEKKALDFASQVLGKTLEGGG